MPPAHPPLPAAALPHMPSGAAAGAVAVAVRS